MGSVVEVVRIKDNGITFDFAALAEFYGMEISLDAGRLAFVWIGR